MAEPQTHSNSGRKAKQALFTLLGWVKSLFLLVFYIVRRLLGEIHAMEQLFLKMYNVYAFLCQLLFFTMCELVILGEPTVETIKEQQGITGLSALLLYCIFGYFVAKVKDICESSWSPTAQSQLSTAQYMKWVVKIMLEWAKAIAIILCLRDQGMKYRPDIVYTLVTFMYYLCTEKLFIELMVKFASYFSASLFDSMEHLYVPIALNIYVTLCAAIVAFLLSAKVYAIYALYASYFLLYLRLKDLYYNYIKLLILEKQTYASFRSATDNEIQKWDDICAVCLNSMSKARITPCNHLFHPFCLKQCLRTSLQCPLCKYDFVQ